MSEAGPPPTPSVVFPPARFSPAERYDCALTEYADEYIKDLQWPARSNVDGVWSMLMGCRRDFLLWHLGASWGERRRARKLYELAMLSRREIEQWVQVERLKRGMQSRW